MTRLIMLSIFLSFGVCASGQIKERAITSFRLDDPKSLFGISTCDDFARAVSVIDTASDFRRIMLVEELQMFLADERVVSLSDCSEYDVVSNLVSAGERARWMIERILDNAVGKSDNAISQKLSDWKTRIAQHSTITDQAIQSLKERYVNKIQIGIVGDAATSSIVFMDMFLDEWFPYGKSLAQMEDIINAKLIINNDSAVLQIDSGFGGYEYHFKTIDGVIYSVRKVGIN